MKTILFLDGVYRAEKHTGANMVVMSEGISNRPMGINIYSSQRQKCRYKYNLIREFGNDGNQSIFQPTFIDNWSQ